MSGYLPIASYGVVGNQETCALVGQNGSIDWLPLPYLDSASVFARILDAESGGHFQLRPTEFDASHQQYVEKTAVLETTFETDGGTLTVVDFMPPIADEDDHPHRALYRKVTCDGGPVRVEMEFQPRFDYARTETELAVSDGGLIATSHDDWLFLSTTETPQVENGTGQTVFSMDDDSRWFVVRYDSQSPVPDTACEQQLEDTVEHWRNWTHDCPDNKCPFAGQWHDLAVRSGMVLKILTARETGAIAAAATTSLPEEIGGVRNWDYRFNWIRDSASVAMILYALGHSEVGEDYHDWLMDLCAVDHPKDLQPVQGLHGDTDLREEELDNLSGYRDSTPVRVGNEAASQTQLDTYGELVLAIDQTAQQEGGVSEDRWDDVSTVVDHVCECWDEKGSGIWEMQTDPKQYTHSKLMCWVALDRGVDMAQRQEFDAPLGRWRNHRKQIRTAIEERGYSDDRQSFVQTLGGHDALDATSILIPIMGFLSFDHDRVQNTLGAIIKTLTTDDGLVRRYDTDDGLPGSDGGFLRASFWLVNALALSGRIEEADEYFDAIVEKGNSIGVFSEEIDPATDEFLGNYPQAYSHVGLASSIVYLNYAHGREMSSEPLGVRLGSGGILDDR
jgi:GH15 family glucan-1,4-alpha-glucosidase